MVLEPWYPKPLCTSPAPYQHEAMMADIILSPIYLPHIYYMLLTDQLKAKTDILLSLYKSLVRPHLEYCIPAWSPHYVKDKELIERIQHRFTRMFPELRKLPYLRRLDYLKLWTLEERRARADLIKVYKIIHGIISSVSFDTFFEFNSYGTTRGHSLKRRLTCDPTFSQSKLSIIGTILKIKQ